MTPESYEIKTLREDATGAQRVAKRLFVLSLKDVDGLFYEEAVTRLQSIIWDEALRHSYLKRCGIIVEVKYTATFGGLEKACCTAIKQIKSLRYDDYLTNDGRSEIFAYGIVFSKRDAWLL